MQYFEVKPHPALQDLVKCYWFLEKSYAGEHSPTETILPDGCIDWVFHFGNGLHTRAGDQLKRQPTSFLIGQQKRPLEFISTGVTSSLGVRFYAYGAYPFVRTSLKDLADKTTDGESIFGQAANELAEKAAELPPLIVFHELEQFLLHRLAYANSDWALIRTATQLLYQRSGKFEVGELAAHVNLAERSLERKFESAVGYSPMTLARVVRFNHIRTTLTLNPQSSLTRLAHQHEYFDQAHFIHDFKQFAGQTPSAFVKAVTDRQIYFYK
jgi:AraC-like DNA-binding protein